MRRSIVLLSGLVLLAGSPAWAEGVPSPLTVEGANLSIGAGDVGNNHDVSVWTLKVGTAQHLRIERFAVLFSEDLGLVFGHGVYGGETYRAGPIGFGMTGTAAVGYSVLSPKAESGGFELLPFVGAFYEFDLNFLALQLGAYGVAAGELGTYWFPRKGLRQYGLGLQFNADFNFSHRGGLFYPGGSLWLEVR